MELYDPFDAEWLKNKFEYYEKMRAMDKPYWSEKYQMYIFTKYADVISILSQPEIFISGEGNLIKDSPYRYNRTPGASDGDIHTKMRLVVKDAYSKSRMGATNEALTSKARELIREELQNDEIDINFVIQMSTAYMVAEMLNLPYNLDYIAELVYSIQQHSSRVVQDNQDDTDYDEFVAMIRAAVEKDDYESPGPGVFDEFMAKSKTHKMISLFTGPAISGAYSMISALQFMVVNLARTGALAEVLADRSLIPNAVKEELRFDATTGKFKRTCTQEINIGGVDLKPGDKVGTCLDAAMRDPAVFPDPNTFDMHRKLGKSTPFGYGPHACAGQALARAGLEAFLEVFLEEVGDYELVTDDLEYVITATGNNEVLKDLIIRRK